MVLHTRVRRFMDIRKERYRSVSRLRIKNRTREILWSILRAFFLLGFCFVILYPMLLVLSKAFMERGDLYDRSVFLIPKHFTLDNIRTAAAQLHYTTTLWNSVWVATLVTVLQTASCLLVGYGFARFEFRFKKILFFLVIFTLIVPPQLTMLSSYLQFQYFDVFGIIKLLRGESLNLMGNAAPLLMMAATCMGLKNGLFIYMLRQVFRGMPRETEEAAYVDGAGTFRTFWNIMLPGALSTVITVMLFSFVWQYNDVLISGTYIKDFKLLPMMYTTLGSVDFSSVTSAALSDYDWQYASLLKSTGVLLMVIPLIILYIVAQRYFTEGIERSGLVG